MISKAHKLGLLTTPYAFNEDEAIEMTKAGADIIVAHMGLTTSGSIGAKTAVSLEESVIRVQAIADAALKINPDAIVLCHGGSLFLIFCIYKMILYKEEQNLTFNFLKVYSIMVCRPYIWSNRSRVYIEEHQWSSWILWCIKFGKITC